MAPYASAAVPGGRLADGSGLISVMPSQVESRRASPARIVDEACRDIVGQALHGTDLAHVTVLLPDMHAASELARRLHRTSGRAGLLPRLTTLRQWAAEVALDEPPASAAVREAAIYHALCERQWFEGQDRWAVAAELGALFDRLTRWHVGMPASAADFSQRLDRAYAARAGATFAFEARLVHELWHALDRGEPGPEAAYQLRLGRLAGTVTGPVYAIGLPRLAPAEEEFLARCAERVRVVRIDEDRTQATSAAQRILAAAWPDAPDAPLQQRAQALRSADEVSALGSCLRFYGAADAEDEARTIVASVCRWLRAGCASIAVVTLDRVVARRSRALLERAQVLVHDEVGWPLSTTSAATAIGRWLDVVTNDFYHRDLLDLLKSPFAFADRPRAARQRAVQQLEQALRRASVRAGLERYAGLLGGERDRGPRALLTRMERAAQALARTRRKSISDWLDALQASLAAIGIRRGLEDDAAGVQLLELLESLGRELAGDRVRIGFGEFRRWLAIQLEAAQFRDPGIESPVVFTSLQATRLRSFDAVLLTGADAARLPGLMPAGSFFNERVRRELGLPGVAEQVRELHDLLAALIERSPQTLVTWQRTVRGEPNLISPLFERLRTLHALAWGDDLADAPSPQRVEDERGAGDAAFVPAEPPAPRIPASAVPTAISASAYNALMACPYQFHARYVLRLRESDEVQEGLEKVDYGMRVHEILTRFHRGYGRVCDLEPAAAEQALLEVSRSVFAADTAHDFVANAWLARWRAVIPGYLAWQRDREAQGWRFHDGEIERSVTVTTPAGNSLVVRGRIDRVDVRADGAVSVIDYKTRARWRLEAELRCLGEDVQLPVYALLWDAPVAEAMYLPVDADTVVPVVLADDVAEHAAAVRTRLLELVDRLHAGAALPAQGIEAVCQYCEMHGLCRRKYWT